MTNGEQDQHDVMHINELTEGKLWMCYFNEDEQKSDNDKNLMLGVYLPIKTNSQEEISLCLLFDLLSLLKGNLVIYTVLTTA